MCRRTTTNLCEPDDGWFLTAAVVEEDGIAKLHLTHVVACLVVPHPLPRGDAARIVLEGVGMTVRGYRKKPWQALFHFIGIAIYYHLVKVTDTRAHHGWIFGK